MRRILLIGYELSFNITIDHETTRHNSDRSSSSVTDEDSSDTGVHLSPHSENYDYQDPDEHDGSWTNVLRPDEIGPSDSASRPRTSNRQRPLVEAPQPEDARRPSYRRRITHERIRNVPAPRSHHSTEPESVDTHDEWQGDARGLQHGRQYPPYAAVAYQPAQYQTFPSHSVVPAGHHQQVIPFGFPGYPGSPGGPTPNYFAPQPTMSPHGGAPYSPPGGYYPYPPQSFPIPQGMPPQPMFHPYPVYSPPPVVNTPPPPAPPPAAAPAAPPSDTSKDDDKFARLEKLLLDQKEEQAAKEAAAEKAAADKAAKDAADAEKAKEIKAASDSAAKKAKEQAEKEHKEAAEKAEKEAKEAAEKAAKEAEAAEAAKPPPPPKEKQKPIKFKDAVGRKFSFPFHLCSTWSVCYSNSMEQSSLKVDNGPQGMEYLIKEAFTHVEVIGPHVEQGHYDLLGPQGEIILPHVWETVVEPDWTITMHMWPMNEEKEPEALADDLGGIEIVEEGLPPPPPPAPSAPGTAGRDGALPPLCHLKSQSNSKQKRNHRRRRKRNLHLFSPGEGGRKARVERTRRSSDISAHNDPMNLNFNFPNSLRNISLSHLSSPLFEGLR